MSNIQEVKITKNKLQQEEWFIKENSSGNIKGIGIGLVSNIYFIRINLKKPNNNLPIEFNGIKIEYNIVNEITSLKD